MKKTTVAFCLAVILTGLAGCATTGLGSGEGAQQAVSAQPAANDEQKRAKVHTELGSLYMLDGRLAIALEEARTALAAARIEPTSRVPSAEILDSHTGVTPMVSGLGAPSGPPVSGSMGMRQRSALPPRSL